MAAPALTDALVALGVSPGAKLGLAVSGGPDSLALLLLAREAGLPVEVATMDHGLRPESSAEAAFVAELCRAHGVPHAILRPASAPVGNVSDWARRERYAALGHWAAERGLAAVLTAHHADDQAETLLMRLKRGAGVSGLAGIRARQGLFVRPLLGWRKAELEAIVAAAGIEPVRDPSNEDARYDRARLRQRLAQADWIDVPAAARSAAALADADEALGWAAAEEKERRTLSAPDEPLRIDVAGLPHELVRRIFLLALAEAGAKTTPRGDAVERAIASLRRGVPATLGGILVRARGGVWTFREAPPRR